MYRVDDQLVLSASDLTGFLACRHLTQLDLLVTQGELAKPHRHDPLLDIISRLGDEHESAHLEDLRNEGLSIVEIPDPEHSIGSLEDRADQTLNAMELGADVIYQATFFDGTWRGHADFLMRVDVPSNLGDWSYEVSDTKLARRAKAAAVLQVCAYSEQVERLQGVHSESAHLVLGDSSVRSFKLRDYVAYYRAVRTEFERTLADSPIDTYPDPVEHCKICKWLPRCMGQRRKDRHLVFVADMRKDQIRKLTADGIPTMDDLANSAPDRKVKDLSADGFARLQDQAALQVEREATGKHRYKLLEPTKPGLGLEALPAQSKGDIFFDIESDAYAADGGLEYLFGWIDGTDSSFNELWAHDQESEKTIFEDFIDGVMARFASYPDMHVYHFGAYEPSALKRLMSRYGTREEEVDRLLRAQVFVDFHRVVKQSMRVSEESYSIKALEVFYDFARTDEITEAGSSMVEYERYRDTGDQAILDEIRDYNEADCRSLVGLRDWLEERRTEAQDAFRPFSRPPILDGLPSESAEEEREEIEQLAARLISGLPIEATERDSDQEARWLLAGLLNWHRREEKSDWWALYDRQKKSSLDLLEDRDTLSELLFEEIDGQVKRSDLYRYSFPSQETKLDRGDSVVDVHSLSSTGTIWELDFDNRKVWLKRGFAWDGEHPVAIGPGRPPPTDNQRDCLKRVARAVIEHEVDGVPAYKAAVELLARQRPRFSPEHDAGPLQQRDEPAVVAAKRLVADLDCSYLPIQGPPGTGKTYTGARMIVDLVRAGKKVGLTANSHKVISNLLQGVCEAAAEMEVSFDALQRCSDETEGCNSALVEIEKDNSRFDAKVASGDYEIVAGTAWALCRAALDQQLDFLFIDESGQFSLANTVAVSTCAHNLVMLGDPQQLNQPTKGVHPEGVDVSALHHVLDSAETMEPDRGLFLEHTFRMHPVLTAYVSEAFYDGRLECVPGRELQEVSGGMAPGIHLVGVEHEGNRIFSWEEADAIGALAGDLLGRKWTTHEGVTKTLMPADLVVVAPFNAQVARIRQRVPAGVPVGTVDKFQGQEGVVAIYSMTTSSPEDIPRNFEFLYSRNRLNVAVSRAKSYAVVVCNPAMLLPMCAKPEHMRLANALSLLAEHASSPVD